MKKGEIFSESNFYKLEDILANGDVEVIDDKTNEKITLSKKYAEFMLSSASNFIKEEKKNKTELAEIFLANSRIAMTVCFLKQVKEADVVSEILTEMQNAKLSDIEKAIKKGVKKAITGEERVMVGRHYGEINELGRVHFVDMEVVKDLTKSYDVRLRQVDPRTIIYLIVNNIKYSLK